MSYGFWALVLQTGTRENTPTVQLPTETEFGLKMALNLLQMTVRTLSLTHKTV